MVSLKDIYNPTRTWKVQKDGVDYKMELAGDDAAVLRTLGYRVTLEMEEN